MKQKLFKTMLLLCALVAGTSMSWADTTATLTLSSSNKFGTSSGSTKTDDDGNTWTCVGSNIQNSYQTSYSGQQFGTGSTNNVFTFTADFSGKTVTGVSITAAAGNATPTYDISVGGNSKKSGSLSKTSTTYSTGAISGTGNVVITLDQNSGGKAVYLGSIVVTYNAVSGEATSTTIDASSVNNNLFGDNTDGGILTAMVSDSSDDEIVAASVTWTSSNTGVATINASTGAVTLVAEGTTTITASYAGVTGVYLSSNDTYELTVIDEDPAIVTIWSEDFSTYEADDVPSGGPNSYVCVDGTSDTKIYENNNAGGISPELLINKSGGSFSATIPLLYPTYGYSGDLTLTFKTNNTNIAVSTSTVGVTVAGSIVSGTSTLTLSGVTTLMENVVITFTNSESSNVRLDDIVLRGKQAALTVVATPSISPASGTVVSGTEVTMSCLTDGATIYYTTDGTTPTSGSTPYNPASKPTITSACTIKAIGIKGGLTDSDVASVTYTIAEPCATPTFSPAGGEVAKGATVTISCGTADATIYYTTDGTTPTTSSLLYSSALTINSAQTIKAIAVKDGNANSEVASATYTIKNYVDLPFAYDGNGLGELPSGLSQSGLTDKYNSSPKMKFDTTGDYLILMTNAAPGELKYDIIGNGFSGGTFKVQYSADGSSYTDLESYTSLGSKTTETFTNIPATTRFIKWIYTSKSSGNVALGNINLTGCESVSVGSAGYTTYVTSDNVSFPDGVTGYIATATTASSVSLTEVAKVPADEPIVIEASAGTYYLPIITTSTDDVSSNILQASDGTINGASGTGYIYALGNKSGVGFYRVASTKTVPAGKAYLELTTPVKEFLTFSFEDDADGLERVQDVQEVQGAIFNLAGQRLSRMQKGINIVNGKKILY